MSTTDPSDLGSRGCEHVSLDCFAVLRRGSREGIRGGGYKCRCELCGAEGPAASSVDEAVEAFFARDPTPPPAGSES